MTHELKVDIATRTTLISAHPLFSLLSSEDIQDLATLMEETHMASGDVIVHEGDIVDTIYLIVEGTAEVIRSVTTVSKTVTMHVAHIQKGHFIGLAETGFFSLTGIRTATVTATSPVVLLTISLTSFQNFLHKPSRHYPALKNEGEKILLMQFIKLMPIFSQLSLDTIRNLSKKVEKTTINSGVTLFIEGDFPDKCYYILSGEIEIHKRNEDGTKQLIATFKHGNTLGETDFCLTTHYSGSARAKTSCELFVINQNIIQPFIKIDRKLLSGNLSKQKTTSFKKKFGDQIKHLFKRPNS